MIRRASLRSAKSLAKVVDDPGLNRAGLQVGRTLVAAACRALRRRPAHSAVRRAAATLRAEGVVVLPDFLPADAFAAVCRSGRSVLDDGSVDRLIVPAGANHTEIVAVTEIDAERRRPLDELITHPVLVGLFNAAERRCFPIGPDRVTVERLHQAAGEPDIESRIHSDTFHHTTKAWLYLTDVDTGAGPMVYVRGSHRLSLASLRGIYRHSRNVGVSLSRRIADSELHRRGLRPPEPVLCGANTLVVADTFGYHGRLQGEPGRTRDVVHVSYRLNPFHVRQALP